MSTPIRIPQVQPSSITAAPVKNSLLPGGLSSWQSRSVINQPGDAYEREADRIADQVLRVPALALSSPLNASQNPGYASGKSGEEFSEGRKALAPGLQLQRQVDPEEEEEEEQGEELIQAKTASRQRPSLDQPAADRFRSLGRGAPLPQPIRTEMERRFGYDFSQVMIHHDSKSNQSAKTINARAYTLGNHIFFAQHAYQPQTQSGKWLLAHELTHTIQQGRSQPLAGQGKPIGRAPLRISKCPTARIQRLAPTGGSINIEPHPAHVPSCGTDPITASARPDNLTGLSWSLRDGSTTVASNTRISAQGRITIGNGQTAGNIIVRGEVQPTETEEGGYVDLYLKIRSHPTGIGSTRVVGALPSPTSDDYYGAQFEHAFNSNDGSASSLEGVAVGERFPNVPNPTGSQHQNIPTPFGPFDLETGTLTNDASDNWYLTAGGELGGTHDNVTFQKTGVNVGHFLQSTSNPNPTHNLPVSFDLDQDFYWYCRTQPASSRWSSYTQTQHQRGLRQNSGALEFYVKVNGQEHKQPYVGHPGIHNARANPGQLARSPQNGPANTSTVTADTLPSPMPARHTLNYSIRGRRLGCSIDVNTGVLSAGQSAGQVTVRVSDSQSANPNYDETAVTIT